MKKLSEEGKALLSYFDTRDRSVIIKFLHASAETAIDEEIKDLLEEILDCVETYSDEEYRKLVKCVSIDREEQEAVEMEDYETSASEEDWMDA